MGETKNDLRFIKTHEAIRTAFENLMQVYSYDKITVKMLTETARINRKTFYLHYSTMDDLLMEIKGEIVQRGIDSIKEYQIPTDFRKMIKTIYSYWQSLTPSDYKAWHSVVNTNREVTFSNGMKCQYDNFAEGFCGGDEVKRQIALAFIIETFGKMYSEWTKNYAQMSLDEIVDVVYNLICHGISEHCK